MGLSFLGGIAKTVGGVAGSLSGASTILATADVVIGGISGGGGTANVANPCPGTPTQIIPELAARFRAFPAEAEALRAKIRAKGTDGLATKDLPKLEGVWLTPDGLAAGVVWKAWGGTNCDVSSKERTIQAEITRIMSIALPPGVVVSPVNPIATGGGTSVVGGQSSPTLATTASSGLASSVLPLLLLVGGVVLVVVLGRRGGK